MPDNIINLNAHPIRVERVDGSIYEFPVGGKALRFNTIDHIIDEYMGIPIVKRIYVDPEPGAIPPKKDGTYYILPNQITQLFTPHPNAVTLNRTDFISPDTRKEAGANRDNGGRITSVKRFKMADEFQLRRRDISEIEGILEE